MPPHLAGLHGNTYRDGFSKWAELRAHLYQQPPLKDSAARLLGRRVGVAVANARCAVNTEKRARDITNASRTACRALSSVATLPATYPTAHASATTWRAAYTKPADLLDAHLPDASACLLYRAYAANTFSFCRPSHHRLPSVIPTARSGICLATPLRRAPAHSTAMRSPSSSRIWTTTGA